MRFIVLGSGTTVPHSERSSSGYWVETGGRKILLDCSAPAIYRATQEGLEWFDLDAIWISHFHMDHCGGLAPFLAGTRHAPQMKDREKPLRIFGGPGLKNLLDAINSSYAYKLYDQPYPLEIREVGHLDKFEIAEGVTAVACSTPHTDESLAIHLRDADDKTLVYTADTGFGKEIAAFAREVDLLVIEASYVKDKKTEKHLELEEAMYLVRKSMPKQAVLTHLYQEWDDVDGEAEIARFSPDCRVTLAHDGLRLEI